jgi:hypothetical protein
MSALEYELMAPCIVCLCIFSKQTTQMVITDLQIYYKALDE